MAAAPDPGGVAAVPVPDTLADAVLARARGLDEPALAVARAGAVIGRSFELDLLGAVSGLPTDAVDHALRRLQERYLVQPSPDQSGFDFRHALIRDALYGDVPPGVRRRLHRLVATTAAGRGYGDAFVSAHFDNGAALAAYQQAHRLLTAAGAGLEAAAVVGRWCAVAHLLGEDLAARARRLEAALASLPAGEETRAVRAELLSGLAAAYMLDRQLDASIGYGERSLALAPADGDDPASLNTAATLGSVLVFAAAWTRAGRCWSRRWAGPSSGGWRPRRPGPTG